jgi:hypothetical protein
MPLLSTIGAAAARAFGFLRSLISGYNVANSLRFNSGSSDNLSRTPASASNRKTFTWSGWVKLSKSSFNDFLEVVGPISPGTRTSFLISDQDNLNFFTDNQTSSSLITTQVFRDFSAWYHIVLAVDTTQSTASDRVKIYVNGNQVTNFSTANYPSQNLDTQINNNQLHTIGKVYDPFFANMYLTEVNFIDGTQLTPSSFGQTDTDTGIWKPKAFSGSYGTNGFYLQFKNSAALGTDSSGNGNTFTVNNLTSVDQSTDTPTNNFATLNPLVGGTSSTFTNGNLSGTIPPINGAVVANIAVNSGKWYCEFKFNGSIGDYMIIGVSDMSKKGWTGTQESDPQCAYYQSGGPAFGEEGTLFTLGTTSGTSITPVTGTVYGLMWDGDNSILKITDGTNTRQCTYTVNNTSTPISFMFAISSGSVTGNVDVNFGSPMYAANSYTDANGFGNFTYAVPSGFYALCTKNLATYG